MPSGRLGETDSVRPRRRVLVGAVLVLVSVFAVLAGKLALGILVGVLLAVAYVELRRILHPAGSKLSMTLGFVAVVAGVWLASGGRPRDLLWVLLALVLLLFALRIVALELGFMEVDGAVPDVAATVTAAGVVGVLGGHVLLIRGTRFGARGLFVFVLAIGVASVVGAIVHRTSGRRPLVEALDPRITWRGSLAALGAATATGAVTGAIWDPPFGPVPGAFLGLAVGMFLPLGTLAVRAIERSAGIGMSASYLPGPRGVLDVAGGTLFAAPVFYWAFRTIVI